jgi:hypothetical protein
MLLLKRMNSSIGPSRHDHFGHPHEAEIDGPFAPFGAPDWNPFLAFRGTVFKYRHRPVPVVFLRFAFSLQLTAFLYQYRSRLLSSLISYICEWRQRDNRSWSRCVSGCGGIGDLLTMKSELQLRLPLSLVMIHTATTAQSVRLIVALSET